MQNITININNFKSIENIPEWILDNEETYMTNAIDQNDNTGILLFIPNSFFEVVDL